MINKVIPLNDKDTITLLPGNSVLILEARIPGFGSTSVSITTKEQLESLIMRLEEARPLFE